MEDLGALWHCLSGDTFRIPWRKGADWRGAPAAAASEAGGSYEIRRLFKDDVLLIFKIDILIHDLREQACDFHQEAELLERRQGKTGLHSAVLSVGWR